MLNNFTPTPVFDTLTVRQTIHINKKLTYALHIQGYGQIYKVKSENLTTTIYSGRSVFGSSGPHRNFRALCCELP